MNLAVIQLLVSILLEYYYFKNIEYNSYLKNVFIYACVLFALNIIGIVSGQISFFIVLIMAILGGCIAVSTKKFVRARTESLIVFIILSGLMDIAIRFCIVAVIAAIL